MKILLDEEIEIYPKIFFWLAKPKEVTMEESVKFLKKDILFIDPGKNFLKIYNKFAEYKRIGVIVNLDEFVAIDSPVSKVIDYLTNIITFVKKDFDSLKFIVHSTRRDEELSNFLDDNNVVFFSNDFVYKDGKIDIFLEKMINSIFDFSNQRTSLRLNFTNTKYTTEIVYGNKVFNGVIKDVSLKGAGLVLAYEMDYNNIHIGDFVTLNIDFKVLFFKISRGVVIRKNQHESLLGVKIDLDDPYMIDNDNMIILNRIVDTWITKLIQKNDFMDDMLDKMAKS